VKNYQTTTVRHPAEILVEMFRISAIMARHTPDDPEAEADPGDGPQPATGVATQVVCDAADKAINRLAVEFVDAISGQGVTS